MSSSVVAPVIDEATSRRLVQLAVWVDRIDQMLELRKGDQHRRDRRVTSFAKVRDRATERQAHHQNERRWGQRAGRVAAAVACFAVGGIGLALVVAGTR